MLVVFSGRYLSLTCFAEPPDHVARQEQQLAALDAVAAGDLRRGDGSGGSFLGHGSDERHSLLDFQR